MIFKRHSNVSTSRSLVNDPREQTAAMSSDASDADCFDQSVLTADEKFELLSAYLDGEVTSDEKCLVEHWISSDLDMKQHYEKQLRLKAAIKEFFADIP